MKKILLITAILLVLLMTGCGKKEEIENNPVQSNPNNQQQVVNNNNVKKPYSNEQLIEMIKKYRSARGEYVPEHIEIEEENGDIVRIHLYDEMEENIATSDWYEIDRNTGIGINVLNEEINLSVVLSNNDLSIIDKYTSLDTFKQKGIVSNNMEAGKFYNIGRITLDDKTYDLKYLIDSYETTDDEDNDISVTEYKLAFFDGEDANKVLVIGGGISTAEYIKELSIFKNKYLVCVTDTNNGDSMQEIRIYDNNLESIKFSNDLNEVFVHSGYNNYYSIDDNSITYTFTEGNEKVTNRIKEQNGSFDIEEVGRTTEGVLEYAGRT